MRKKQFLAATLVLVLMLAGFFSYSSHAATTFKSNGRIDYNNGTPNDASDDVIFDASDLITLNTSITNLDTRITDLSTSVDRGKETIIDSLEKYPGVDLGGADTNPSFDDIANTIDNLTNIPANTYFYEEGTEGSARIKRYKKENGKYYECDANGKVASGAKEVNVAGKTLHDYANATAGKISAGYAAFADGTLHLGDGSDNIAYYNRGVAAGESKSKVGTATADKVLSGYTFTNTAGVGIAGTMVNRGTLNWNPTSNTTQTIQPGYYSGGTLNSAGAYNAGVAKGAADSRVGTATADKVLTGYTFTNSAGAGIAGTMVNRGTLNWNPSSGTTQTIQPGYYSGGTLDSSGAYAQGFIDGQQNVTQSLQISYTYHKHVGNSTSNGGCYTTPISQDTYITCYHDWTNTEDVPGSQWKVFYHSVGKIASAPGSAASGCVQSFSRYVDNYVEKDQYTHQYKTGTRVTGYGLSCGKTEQTVESATITY